MNVNKNNSVGVFDCPICEERYTATSRAPKIETQCGYTACTECWAKIFLQPEPTSCSNCRKPITLTNVIPNHALRNAVDETANRSLSAAQEAAVSAALPASPSKPTAVTEKFNTGLFDPPPKKPAETESDEALAHALQESLTLQPVKPPSISRTFVSQFFVRSSGVQYTPIILADLKELENRGYSIDETNTVFGPSGESWPLLNQTKGVAIAIGLAVATSASSRCRGAYTLEQYLQREIEMSKPSKPSSLAQVIELKVAAAACAAESAPASSSAPQSNPSIDRLFAMMGSNVSVNMANMTLQRMRELGIFTKEPGQPQNSLSQEQLVGASLFITRDERCAITKGGVVACSPELNIGIQGLFGKYNHGNNIFSDVPFRDAVKVQTTITRDNVASLLPYLQALPMYSIP